MLLPSDERLTLPSDAAEAERLRRPIRLPSDTHDARDWALPSDLPPESNSEDPTTRKQLRTG